MSDLIPSLNFSANSNGPDAYLFAASQKAAEALKPVREALKFSHRMIWKNPEFTPAQMIAAMGTKAKANFENHASGIAYLARFGVIIPPEEYTPLTAYTPHEDGTITLD